MPADRYPWGEPYMIDEDKRCMQATPIDILAKQTAPVSVDNASMITPRATLPNNTKRRRGGRRVGESEGTMAATTHGSVLSGDLTTVAQG